MSVSDVADTMVEKMVSANGVGNYKVVESMVSVYVSGVRNLLMESSVFVSDVGSTLVGYAESASIVVITVVE